MSKTLHHGLLVLRVLSEHPQGLTVSELADAVGVHRTVAHRLVRTLEAHQLCRRDHQRRIVLGTGLVSLAEPVQQDLRALARPILDELAETTRATAHLLVREGATRMRALMVVEPRGALVHVSFRPGQTHSIERGSGGIALLAHGPYREGERSEVTEARAKGYAVTTGEVIPAVTGISAAVPPRGGTAAVSIGISVFEYTDLDELGTTVVRAATALGELLD
ncbi:IclR family transcriptional regulator [Streptomyces sp. NWU339]|uniref:IclR family transcriptional regulator n=1 Tax=Streptomyces sp. NWU339 TaxID=2185284 RepID=UPI000D674DA8|nr:helix-turn-helix domain-containing protein [Streptomyces sp. NWU339]PWI11667.1 IclR family transcriptional regulator [Streptomyces sp. NWU339]